MPEHRASVATNPGSRFAPPQAGFFCALASLRIFAGFQNLETLSIAMRSAPSHGAKSSRSNVSIWPDSALGNSLGRKRPGPERQGPSQPPLVRPGERVEPRAVFRFAKRFSKASNSRRLPPSPSIFSVFAPPCAGSSYVLRGGSGIHILRAGFWCGYWLLWCQRCP